MRTKTIEIKKDDTKSESYKKGILANFLNPHPYVFWMTVNAPMLFNAYEKSLYLAILYLFVFYSTLIFSKIAVALIISKSKAFLNQQWYRTIMIVLGIALLIFSFLFFMDAFKYLSIKFT